MKINKKELFIGIGLLLMYILIIPDVILLLFHLFQLDLNNEWIYLLANVLVYVFSFLLIFFVYHKSLKEEFKLYFKNFKTNFKIGFSYWLKALCFMMLSNLIIVSISGGIATNEEQNRSLLQMMPIFSAISMIFIGPFLEEILFRKSFRKALLNTQTYLIVSSLLFGFAHLISAFNIGTIFDNWTQILYLIPYSGIGYFFAKAYIETDSIFTSVVIHMIHNSLSVLLILLAGV